jgi:hypothetical protein
MRNKPNFRRPAKTPGADCAKRTQFPRQPPVGRGLGDEDRGGQSCRTNPISGGCRMGRGRRGGGRRANCVKQTQFGLAWAGRRASTGETCKTNPIGPRQAGKTIAKAGGLDAATRHTGQTCKTKPIPDGAGRDGAGGASDEVKTCKTNPIGPAGPGGTRPQGRGTRGKCAKRSQFGPASAGPGRRWAKDAKRTQFGGVNVRNEANLLRGHGRPSPRPKALPLPPGRRLRGLFVRNKPNLSARPEMGAGRRSCHSGTLRQTNPIRPRGRRQYALTSTPRTASRCCRLAPGASGLLRRCGYNEPGSPGVL